MSFLYLDLSSLYIDSFFLSLALILILFPHNFEALFKFEIAFRVGFRLGRIVAGKTSELL